MSSTSDDLADARYEFETVFVGPPSEAYVARSVLDDLGFLTHIANANIKMIDPFVTGLNPLDVRLQVPRSDAERASRALREARGEGGRGERLRESTGEYDPDLVAGLDDLSRRIRWATVSLFLAPVAALLGLLYIMRTLPLQTRPAHHGFTMTAIVVSWTVWLLVIAAWVILSGIGT